MNNRNSAAAVMGHERLEVQARKFYSQRNMYLCGFTLFLSLILNRTYVMILEVMELEDRLRAFESNKNRVTADPEKERLKKELASKETDLETLKKQCEGLQREYNNLSDKVTDGQGTEPKKTK
jgi:septal ring factor EnvC (AmiA/AmiB activator)